MSLADHLPARWARILTIDIENTPHELYGFGLYDQNFGINQIKQPGSVFCFAAKWLGEKDVMFFSDHEHGHAEMIRQAHRLLSEADIVVGFNSDSFDLKKLNWEFELARLGKPRPYRTVDLLKVARSQFGQGPASKKLDYLVQQLGLGAKTHHQGMPLWIACMNGSEVAWRKMRRYNEQDIRITERLYNRWLPWIPNHPNMALYLGVDGGCPNCGGKSFRKDGVATTAQTQYAQSQCKKCGAWVRNNFVKERSLVRVVK
jgi:hypothetical protein